jgi:hypothetical protein
LDHLDVVFITEGECDTLIVFQEVNDLVGACTLGSASGRLDIAEWGCQFIPIQHIITVYDNDAAGERGAQSWGSLGGRVKQAKVPEPYKDINEFFIAGGKVADWVMATLKSLGVD